MVPAFWGILKYSFTVPKSVKIPHRISTFINKNPVYNLGSNGRRRRIVRAGAVKHYGLGFHGWGKDKSGLRSVGRKMLASIAGLAFSVIGLVQDLEILIFVTMISTPLG